VTAHPRERALFALDRPSSRPLVRLIEEKRLAARASVGAADMFPLTLEHVRDGRVAYTFDEEPYLQGFLPVQQLFLARFSGGLAAPVDVRIPLKIVARGNVAGYLKARTRFEGSSSRRAPVVP
jgi:simple sugar transport system substrate-binding protein